MKTTRRTLASARKKKTRRRRSRCSGLDRSSANGRVAISFQSASPLSTTIIFEIRPPMLCPTSTFWSSAESVLDGSTTSRSSPIALRRFAADTGKGVPVGYM